ncbi:MAG: tetraacyldisaccharide 4'-kinase, partial [Bacteroidota bacterium]
MQLLRKIGYPLSPIYAAVVHVRNYLYDLGVYSSSSFDTPTICVGNLSVGGTGKTPMIEFLVSELQATHKLAVLSRGYGRKSKGLLLANEDTGVEELGDEPFQIYVKFPNLAVVVDADRRNGISYLEDTIKPDIILLDDAYQHRKVRPSLSILLTAFDNLYSDDAYLPAGDLRDSRGEAKRADIIVVTKCPLDLDISAQAAIKKKLKPHSRQLLLFSSLVYERNLKGFNEPMILDDLKDRNVTLITGIAKPGPLVSFLKKEEIQLEHLSYRDHHFFTDREIALFNSKEMILTTEKDFMRLKNKVTGLRYVEVKHL